MNDDTYIARRKRLAKTLGRGAVAIICGATNVPRNADNDYPFRQDGDFLYLTGFSEPKAVLVILGGTASHSILFCAQKDPVAELWTGARMGPAKAKRDLGFTEAYPATENDTMWGRLCTITNPAIVAHTLSFSQNAADRLGAVIPPDQTSASDLHALIGEMRLIKSKSEQAIMLRAATISALAHKAVLSLVQPHMNERDIEALLTYRFRVAGGDPLHAYPPIVAAGKNACTLHYNKNNAVIKNGDLVLVDAGCEIDGYASDITRTFPASGKFSPAQRKLYDIVLRAQLAGIAATKPGVKLSDVHTVASLEIAKGLIELGFVYADDPAEVIARGLHRPFFPHGTSHWLGSDVHDSGDYQHQEGTRKSMRELKAGMVITVEPGLYIRPQKGIPRAFWNIGIRIEDDVLVTKTGHKVLSAEAPKDPDEIERTMSAR